MHNFKSGLKIVSFLCILSIMLEFCNDLVAEPAYTRLMLHEMYNNDENYTMAFLGASHTYHSFNPIIFDDQLNGCNSINLGSSSQSLMGTYFLLKEFLKTNNPDMIIMEITYSSYENIFEESMVAEYALFDYMKPSLNKLQYFFSAFPQEDYGNALFPIYRNRTLLEITEISKKYNQKRDNGYYEYRGFGENGWQYLCKGFVYVDWSFQNKDLEIADPYEWNESWIREENIEYLKKITDLCVSKNIEIIWVTAPVAMYGIIEMDNYEETHNYFETLAQKCAIEYYDFNYCRKEILERNDYLYFYDSSHMNGIYAEKFSNIICQMLREREKKTLNYDAYFYRTYDEMIGECQSSSLDNFLND